MLMAEFTIVPVFCTVTHPSTSSDGQPVVVIIACTFVQPNLADHMEPSLGVCTGPGTIDHRSED